MPLRTTTPSEMTFRARRAGVLLSAVLPLCYAFLGVWAGKDGGWDLLNYHWYNPFAFLTGRVGFDLAVSHHATYYNPLLDLPLYLAGEHLPASWVGFLLSLVQGVNGTLLFWLAWTLFSPLNTGHRFAVSAATSIAGMSGAGALMEVAAVCHDNITSLGVLAALLVIASRHRVLLDGDRLAAGVRAGVAGIFIGAMTGLKLTNATYALGIGGALLLVPASLPRRTTLAVSFGIGALLGLGLAGGAWMHRLWEFSGNPFFPYFNDLFHSPLLLDASYKDNRFIPRDLVTRLFFPFYFSFDSFRVAEWYFRDVRILTAYVILPCSGLWLLCRKARGRRHHDLGASWVDPARGRFLVIAAAISYAAWLWMFCIYRYLLPLEMISPLLVAVGLSWLSLSNRARTSAIFALLVLSQALVQVSFSSRQPWDERYVEVTAPEIPPDEQAMVLMAGHAPMAFVIPSFPPSIPFLRIQGWLASPNDGSRLTATMRQRVKEHRGARYVLFHPDERDSATKALAAYSLGVDAFSCRGVPSNLTDTLTLCRVSPSRYP